VHFCADIRDANVSKQVLPQTKPKNICLRANPALVQICHKDTGPCVHKTSQKVIEIDTKKRKCYLRFSEIFRGRNHTIDAIKTMAGCAFGE
jgi:hypothetical protein